MLISGQEGPRLLLLLVQSNNLNQRRTPIVSSVLAIFWLNSFHGKYSSLDGKCLDSYELTLSTKLILHRYWNSLKLWWNRLWIADGFQPLLSDCWKMNRSQLLEMNRSQLLENESEPIYSEPSFRYVFLVFICHCWSWLFILEM